MILIPPPLGEGGSERSEESGGAYTRHSPHPIGFADHPPLSREG